MSEYGDILYQLVFERLIAEGKSEAEARIEIHKQQRFDILYDAGLIGEE